MRSSIRDRLVDRGEGWVVPPDYDGYSVHRAVPTAMAALGADVGPTLPADAQPVSDVDRVLFVLVDGLGLERWRAASDPLTERFETDGTVTPLTSVYPSETAAAMPSVHTATPPATHGSIGWDQWVARTGTTVQTLPFTAAGAPAGEHGVEPDDLFVGRSVYGAAAEADVRTTFANPEGIVGSPASTRHAEGTAEMPYYNVADMAQQARRALEGGPNTFAYCYAPEVDHVGHAHGIASEQAGTQRRLVAHAVGRELLDRLDPATARRTLVVVTADHGQFDTTGSTDLRELPEVWENLREHDGEPIPPVGSGRNVHLHLRSGAVPEARAAVEDAVDCRTFTHREAVEGGLFGPDPGERIRERCGDLVVVPREEALWHDPAMMGYVGMHGGLTPEEMLVPFAVGRASDLQA